MLSLVWKFKQFVLFSCDEPRALAAEANAGKSAFILTRVILLSRLQNLNQSHSSGAWLWIWGAPLRVSEIKINFQDVYSR